MDLPPVEVHLGMTESTLEREKDRGRNGSLDHNGIFPAKKIGKESPEEERGR